MVFQEYEIRSKDIASFLWMMPVTLCRLRGVLRAQAENLCFEKNKCFLIGG